jgi:transposase-like protein
MLMLMVECPRCGHAFRRSNKRSIELDMSDMSRRYRSGDSLRTCAAAAGVSYSTMRNRLIEAGVQLRTKRGTRDGVR